MRRALYVALAATALYAMSWLATFPVPNCVDTAKMRRHYALSHAATSLVSWLGGMGVIDEIATLRWMADKRFANQHFVSNCTDTELTLGGVPALLVTPPNRTAPGRGIFHVHGGGWMLGSPRHLLKLYHKLAEETGSVVVGIDYPLRPDHPWEEMVDGVVRSARYFIQHAETYGVDPNRILIMGESAGAHLAACLCLRLRAEGVTPPPRAQYLLYGIYQALDLGLPSYQQHAMGPFNSRDTIARYWSLALTGSLQYAEAFRTRRYVPDDVMTSLTNDTLSHAFVPVQYHYPPYSPGARPDFDQGLWDALRSTVLQPSVSPLLAPSHAGLPEAYLVSGVHDIFRDESFLYERRLRRSGVQVTHYVDPVGTHAGLYQFHNFQTGNHTFQQMVKHIRTL